MWELRDQETRIFSRKDAQESHKGKLEHNENRGNLFFYRRQHWNKLAAKRHKEHNARR